MLPGSGSSCSTKATAPPERPIDAPAHLSPGAGVAAGYALATLSA
jgi:hypothetical protein